MSGCLTCKGDGVAPDCDAACDGEDCTWDSELGTFVVDTVEVREPRTGGPDDSTTTTVVIVSEDDEETEGEDSSDGGDSSANILKFAATVLVALFALL